MKRLKYIFISLLLVACSSEDGIDLEAQAREKFIIEAKGVYRLHTARLNNPIDINNDGIAHTNMLDELNYCGMSRLYESYKCNIYFRQTYNTAIVTVPASEYGRDYSPQRTCIQDIDLFYELEYDFENNTAVIAQSDFRDNQAARVQTEILDMTWQPGKINFTFKKEFYNSDEVWQEVILYMEFLKTDERL